MIDPRKVKAFWDARASACGRLDFDSIANLEEDARNLALKVELETEKVFAYLGSVAGRTMLDLGAGVGQWAFRFLERGATAVTAVEYSEALAQIGQREAVRRGVPNLRFVVSPAEEYSSAVAFDMVFISGLFVYMNDDQAEKLAGCLPRLCRADALVLVRDGTGVPVRHEIDNRLSERLGTRYSAIYRTADEYAALFARNGFALVKHENMFEEGCPLNMYPETRLRIYRFGMQPDERGDA
jgi:SAM-dependent methyltransferase